MVLTMEKGYDPNKVNVGFNEGTGKIQLEIDGLVEPKSAEAQRICEQDINEVIAAYVQDPRTVEQGMFNENLPPEELTQVKMGRIIKEKYPNLDEEDQEAVRQRAITAVNVVQKAKSSTNGQSENTDDDAELTSNTALIDGVRKFAMNVRDLDIDLIDHINPFGEAYAILAKTMSEASLKRFAEVIASKKINMTEQEARDLAVRAGKFKEERGRLPEITSVDPWEKRMAEGIEYLRQKVKKENNE